MANKLSTKYLRKLLEEREHVLSQQAYAIIDSVLDYVDEYDDIDELDEEIRHEIDNSIIYYCDAWNYLQENQITDFYEAINEFGLTGVTSIACYYIMDEIQKEYLYEIWRNQ